LDDDLAKAHNNSKDNVTSWNLPVISILTDANVVHVDRMPSGIDLGALRTGSF